MASLPIRSCHLQKEIIFQLLVNLDGFYIFLFFCLFTLARTDNDILNSNGKISHPFLATILRRKAVSLSLNVMLAVGFSYIAFVMLMSFPSIRNLSVFILKGVENVTSFFSIIWKDPVGGFYLFLLIWCITLIDIHILKLPSFQGINPTWHDVVFFHYTADSI